MKLKVLAALAALAIAQPASAAIYELNAYGTLSAGFDQSGMFGAPGTDLTGLAYSVVEYFDTTKGAFNNGGFILYGGSQTCPGCSSPGYGVLTINGVSVTVNGAQIAWLVAPGAPSTVEGFVYDDFRVGSTVSTSFINARVNNMPPGPHIDTLPEWHSDCVGVGTCHGGFGFEVGTNLPGGGYVNEYRNWGDFAGEYYDVRLISGGVPEPATWAMMIAGFGLVGGALRRRAAMAV